VTLEDVRDPSLPFGEQRRQRRRHACVAHPMEQLGAGGRRPRSSVEQQHADLATVERLVQDGQVADHHSEEPEPGRPREDHDGAGPAARRRGSDPKGEQRRPAGVQGVVERAVGASQPVEERRAPQDERKPQQGERDPSHQLEEEEDGGRRRQDPFPGCCRLLAQAEPAPRPARAAGTGTGRGGSARVRPAA
jgi:hypothetical protein